MDNFIDPGILVPLGGMLTAIVIVSVNVITNHFQKIEKIKADALVRAEEVRARNQLEIEKLYRADGEQNNSSNNSFRSDDERSVRERARV